MFENHGKGIGEKGKDNGLLIVLAVDDRQVWVEVGYDLEGFVTDGFAGETSRETMVPFFRTRRLRPRACSPARRASRSASPRAATSPRPRAAAAARRTERRRGAAHSRSASVLILLFIFLNMMRGGGARRRGAGAASGRWSSGVGGAFGGGGFGGGFGGGWWRVGGGVRRRRFGGFGRWSIRRRRSVGVPSDG